MLIEAISVGSPLFLPEWVPCGCDNPKGFPVHRKVDRFFISLGLYLHNFERVLPLFLASSSFWKKILFCSFILLAP